jgi:hypothetical protein
VEVKDAISLSISGAVLFITAISVVKGLIEYKRQGVTRRAEMLLKMRSKLREDPAFAKIASLLEEDSEQLRDTDLADKERFLCFFEEVSLMHNSGLMNDQVAFYMFGHLAVLCLNSRNFWHKVNINHIVVAPFRDFAEQMQRLGSGSEHKTRRFHL